MSPEPMGWTDYALARQQQVEERIGTRIREAKALEEAKAARSRKALTQQERRR